MTDGPPMPLRTATGYDSSEGRTHMSLAELLDNLQQLDPATLAADLKAAADRSDSGAQPHVGGAEQAAKAAEASVQLLASLGKRRRTGAAERRELASQAIEAARGGLYPQVGGGRGVPALCSAKPHCTAIDMASSFFMLQVSPMPHQPHLPGLVPTSHPPALAHLVEVERAGEAQRGLLAALLRGSVGTVWGTSLVLINLVACLTPFHCDRSPAVNIAYAVADAPMAAAIILAHWLFIHPRQIPTAFTLLYRAAGLSGGQRCIPQLSQHVWDVVCWQQLAADHPDIFVYLRQCAGQRVSVPAGWVHAVLTLEPCVKVAWDVMDARFAAACVMSDADIMPHARNPDWPAPDYMGLHPAMWELFLSDLPDV